MVDRFGSACVRSFMRHVLIIAAVLTACAGSRRGVDHPKAPPQGELTLGFAEITVSFSGMAMVRAHADGSVEEWEAAIPGSANAPHQGWVPRGTLTTDGRLMPAVDYADASIEPSGEITADGTFHARSGAVKQVKLDADAVEVDGVRLTLD